MNIIPNSLVQMQAAEQATVNKALSQILNREPTKEDYKKCIRVRISGNPEKWYLKYAGINMGWIEYKIEGEGMDFKYHCTFTPDDISPEKEPAIFDEVSSTYTNNITTLYDCNNDESKNANIIREEFKLHGGQLVIYEGEVVKFEGVDLDDEFDYYYIFRRPKKEFSILYVSGVASFIPLKGFIKESDYKWLLSNYNYSLDIHNVDKVLGKAI